MKRRLTSRDRPKSAPYLRLKNSKRTSKCQNILFYSTQFFCVSQCRKKLKGETLWDFSTSVLSQNFKNEGGPFVEFFSQKNFTMPKKVKGGPLVLSGIVCYAGNIFGSVPNRGNLRFCRTFGRTFWSLQVYRKKH